MKNQNQRKKKMNKQEFKIFLKEQIFKLLEEETQYQIGDPVSSKDGDGNVRLSKHPYYSVTLDDTGVTKSFHFSELQPIEDEFGKYDINESPTEDLIKFVGVLILKDDVWMIDILSSIRSIQGITIVRNEEINPSDKNERSKLHIKIDPYTFGSQSGEKIEKLIITQISQVPGVKSFIKIKHEDIPKEQPQITSPIPVSNIKDLQETKVRIKLSKPHLFRKDILVEQRIVKEIVGLNESNSISHYDTEMFLELANPDMAHSYEETQPKHWNFDDKYGNKLEVIFDQATTYIESYFLLKNKEGDWVKVYDYDKVKWNIAPEYQLSGGTDEGRSDTICKIIRDEIIPKYLLNKKPQFVKLHPLNDYRYKVFMKCAQVCQEKYPQIEIKEMGQEILLINK